MGRYRHLATQYSAKEYGEPKKREEYRTHRCENASRTTRNQRKSERRNREKCPAVAQIAVRTVSSVNAKAVN
jgi:hypothetical protein